MIVALLMFRSLIAGGTSVFAMGSSRNVSFSKEAQLLGRICRVLVSAWSVRLVSDQIGLVWSSSLVSLFHDNMYEVEIGAEQGVFGDDLDPIVMACVWRLHSCFILLLYPGNSFFAARSEGKHRVFPGIFG